MKGHSPTNFELEHQVPEPLDEATKAAIEVGLAQIERGEILTEEEADALLESRYQEWVKSRKMALQA